MLHADKIRAAVLGVNALRERLRTMEINDAARRLTQRVYADAEFREADHPRDADGKFGSGGGGSSSKENKGRVEPQHFSALHFAHTHDEPTATRASVLKHFAPDVASQIKDYEQRLNKLQQTKAMHTTEGKYTSERKALHETITQKILGADRIKAAMPKAGEKPTFTILGGRGGSGKSWFDGKVYDPESSIVLDADAIKKMLPEYEGWNAAQVHEESGDIFDEITDQAKALGLNLVHDATMKAPEKAVRLAKSFKDDGYRVEAHYMHLPRQEAAKRAVERFLGKTRRLVPPEIVLSNIKNEEAFDDVKKLADKWSFRDNNVSRGEEPRLISQSHDDDE